MKRMNQFSYLRLLLAMMLVMMTVLAACSSKETGNGGNDPAPVKQDNKNDAETDTDKEKDPNAVVKDKTAIKGEVRVLTPWGAGMNDMFLPMFEDFNKEYPNINVIYMEQGTGELAALIAAGEAPDLIATVGNAPELRDDDQIVDILPLFSTDPEVNEDLYYEPAYVRSLTADGKLWGLPWHVDPNFAFMYNPEILDQYGYSELPEINSLQEFGDFLKEFWVVRNGEQEMTTFLPNDVYGPFNTLETMAFLNGATHETFFNGATMTSNMNDPLIVQALEWIVRFKRENIDYDRLGKLDATLPENTGRFQAGKSLLEPHVTINLINNYKLNPDLKFAPMPAESLWIGGWSFSMTTSGYEKNREAAWELLKWLTSTKEGAASQLEHFGWISGIRDFPALEEAMKTSPPLQAAYDVLQRAKRVQVQAYVPVNFEPEFNEKWGEVMDGNLEPKEFLDHINTYTQKLLDEKYK